MRAGPEGQAATVQETKNPPADTGTVLVVDDSAGYRKLLSRLLRQRGHVVLVADGAEAVFASLVQHRPDLILLDVRMPGMDGYELCARLKAAPDTRDIPVIFISGADGVLDKLQAFACGGIDYIAKPFQAQEVLERIATHLALRNLQKRLEERVDERTDELAAANARLEAEIADRRNAEETLRAVLESAPDAMVIVDHERRIVLVNSQVEMLFGYDRAELLGQPVEVLVPERFRRTHAARDGARMGLMGARPMGSGPEVYARRRDGSEFPAEISLSPLNRGGRTLVISAIRNVSARRAIERELVESRQRLRELAAHRETVREAERKRIAGEIHDELGSLLTALKMELSLLRMQAGDNAVVLERVSPMRELVEETISMVRKVAIQLRPTSLDLGVVPALEWLLEDFGRRTGIVWTFSADGSIQLADAAATAVFRIVQESLTNITRHAEAARVEVTLVRADDGTGRIVLRVRDDGRGFEPSAAAAATTFGLLGIRERALMLGAAVTIDSAPGRGTTVALDIPEAEERR